MRKITLSFLVLLFTMVTQGAWADIIPWSGNGTANNPYLIQSSKDWDMFALTVSMQSDFHDKYYRLTNDINVSSMVGMSLVAPNQTPNPFRGTFDGDGHTITLDLSVTKYDNDTPAAPFAQLSGATIKNLNVAGSITTNGRRPASITSFVTGSSTITNCTSSVAITSSKEYDVDAGGFVGRVNTGSTLTLSNCLFTGSIAYSDATGYGGGGLVGFLQTNATANLTNCVFAPTSVSFARTYIDFNMFANGEKNGNLDPCYINITNCFYDVSDGDHWKITGQGTHIPATIENNTDWQNFGTVVAIGYDYSGKTVTLGNDVSGVSKVVGTVDRPFAGTFDGQGNKLTVNINVSSDNEHTPAAPFAAISGATIKNLHVAGSISSNCYRPAGIASFVTDDSEITNCKSSVNITASRSADIDAGAFVGRVNENKTITMTGCTFTGSINFSHTYGYEGGGMVGWTQTGASANLTNCLFAPTSVSFANSKSMAENNFHMIAGGIGSSTLTRCYYNNVAANNTKIIQEGKQTYTISKGTGVAYVGIGGVGTTYSVSGIVVFSGGIEFNEVFYAGGDEVVNLLLAPGADPELNYHFYRYKVESGGGSIVTNLRNSATLTMSYSNQTISAEWKYLEIYFDVTFAKGNDNEGWTIDPTFARTISYVTVSYAGVHKVKSVTNNVPNVEQVDATHYKFVMPDFDAEVSTELWYKLDEAADNSALAGKTNVFLKRTLQPGGWNTFCAPFAIADPASVFGAGVKVKQLTGASVTGNTLTLTFDDAASIAAGTPYLIKLNGEDPVDLAADGKEFEGVTQDYTAHPTTIGGVVSFVPVINPTAMTADDKTKLFVTGGNKLTHPSANGNINGFRAYFQLLNANARSFVLDLGDGETTGLNLTPTLSQGEGVWYTLDGRKLQGKPTTKGVYIVNGKKTIIK